MSDQPLITIIMNCYNGAKYLRHAIDSVLGQTWRNWELIFWDNQSVDNSAEIFSNYNDPRLKYFLAPHHTYLYEARNYAMEHAKGEFFAFLDVDDWWEPEKLERQMPFFQDPHVGIVCGNFRVCSEKKRKVWVAMKKSPPVGWVLPQLLECYYVGLLTLTVRREAVESLDHLFDSRFHIIGDFDFVIRLATKWKLRYLSEPLANYRIHGNNETAKHQDRQISELKVWQSKMGMYPSVSLELKGAGFSSRLAYLQGINELMRGNKAGAIAHLKSMRRVKLGMRFIILLILPNFILMKIKN